MTIPKLDRRITFQAATDTISPSGGFSASYADIATVWAKIDFSTPISERQESDKETAFTSLTFWVRYDSRFLDKKHRISYDSKVYDILSVLEEGRKKYLKILAQIIE